MLENFRIYYSTNWKKLQAIMSYCILNHMSDFKDNTNKDENVFKYK